MFVPEEVLRDIRQRCWQSPQAEVCGIVDALNRIHPIRNAARDQTRHFVFDKREFCAALGRLKRDGVPVKAYYHTHPLGTASPSAADAAYVRQSKVTALIVAKNDYTVVTYKEE